MLRRWWHARNGNYAVISALAMVPIMTGVGVAVDFSNALNLRDNAQNALDSAALRMGADHFAGIEESKLAIAGEEHYRANLGTVGARDPTFSYKLEAGTGGGDDVIALRSTFQYESYFASFIRRHSLVAVESAVGVHAGAEACTLALHPSASAAVKLEGSTSVTMEGCVIAANSNSSAAVQRTGQAALQAACVSTVGGTSGLNSTNVNLACGQPREKQPPARDPLADLNPPSYTTCQNVPGSRVKTLSPGTFCDRTISGEVTLQPGNYILRGGKIDLGGNGTLIGEGVTIFLMEGASMTITANQHANLKAPETGSYAGIAIYQARDNSSPLTLLGGGGSNVTGFIYAPAAHIDYGGGSSMTGNGDCTRLVGRTLQMRGNSKMSSDCEKELGGNNMFVASALRLIK